MFAHRFIAWTLAFALAFCPALASAQSPQVRAAVLNYKPALAVAAGGYTAQGVHFISTTQISRHAALTGVTDSKVGMLSFWFRGSAATDGANIILLNATSNGIQIARLSSGSMRVLAADVTSTNIMIASTTATFNSADGWKSFIASWNLATATIQIYVEDVLDTNITTNSNVTIPYATSQTDYIMPNPGLPGPYDIADFWLDPDQAPLDMTVTANRRKFITVGLAPVNLGAAGATPTGTSPAIFFSGAVASWNTNKGTGGGFTLDTGTITAASSNPP